MKKAKKPPLYKSFGYAFEGIFTCIRNERNIKIHCTVAILVVIAGAVLGITPTEWCICPDAVWIGDSPGAGQHCD